MESKRRYLIVGPSWVGDMVMAQSLFITLKQQYPDCEIDVVSPEWSLPILERMPEVSSGIGLSVLHGKFSLLIRYRLGKTLRHRGYTHAIVLPRSWKSALVPYFARVPVRIGFKGEMRVGLLNDIRPLNKMVLTQTVQRYVALGRPDSSIEPEIPFPGLTSDEANCQSLLKNLDIDLSRLVIAMMPGAEYGPAKQWPIAYYAQLARKLAEAGYQVWVLGSAKEQAAGATIAQAAGDNGYNLCGKTRLVDVIDLIVVAEQVVSNDSGLMHVAAATGVQVNAIYGSSTPDYTPPLTKDELKSVFYRGLECSPCFKRSCPLGHTDCLNGITVEEVFTAMTGKP